MSERPDTRADEPPAPLPPWVAQEAWTLQPGAPPRQRRSRGAVLGGLVLVLALVAGLFVYQATRPSGQAEAASLALSFSEGQTLRYRLHMTMEGTVRAEAMGLPDQPLDMDMTQTMSWRIVSVDSDGVATIEVAVEDMSGTANGVPVPDAATEGMTTRMRVAPDGRILSAGGVTFSAPVDPGLSSFPGLGQMTPLLPDHPVAPGDTWEKDFSQKFPFGKGALDYTTRSTLERYEEVDGASAAVVTTAVTLPLDFTFRFGKLLRALGGGPTGPEAAQLARASIAYGGRGTFTMTSWVDTGTRELVRNETRGTFDMTMTLSGIPDMPDGASFEMEATFTQDMQRL